MGRRRSGPLTVLDPSLCNAGALLHGANGLVGGFTYTRGDPLVPDFTVQTGTASIISGILGNQARVGRALDADPLALIVEPYRVDDKDRDRLVPTGRTFVVVDCLGAGVGEMVLICQGSSARLTPETEKLPIDAVVIGLVDTVDLGGKVVFSSRDESR